MAEADTHWLPLYSGYYVCQIIAPHLLVSHLPDQSQISDCSLGSWIHARGIVCSLSVANDLRLPSYESKLESEAIPGPEDAFSHQGLQCYPYLWLLQRHLGLCITFPAGTAALEAADDVEEKIRPRCDLR